MLKTSTVPNVIGKDDAKNRFKGSMKKRPHSITATPRAGGPAASARRISEKRCQSLSPSIVQTKRSFEFIPPPKATEVICYPNVTNNDDNREPEKDTALPHCVLVKMMRLLATKKREFMKYRKIVMKQQNILLEQYAAVKELEARAGQTGDASTGETRLVSVTGWQAHDLLLLVRNDLQMALNSDMSLLGDQISQKLHAQLNPIPDEVLEICAEIMARRLDILNMLRDKHRTDRASYLTNLEWHTKHNEFDKETERLHKQVVLYVENLKEKLKISLNVAKISWLDREALIKKLEKAQKENMILQGKLDEVTSHNFKKDDEPIEVHRGAKNSSSYKTVCEELAREKAARDSLKEVVASAESMLRVARAKIATLERQLKDVRVELELAKKKQRDLEQLYRHRETSYDARSKKLLEVSKTGESTIEALSRQRDALEQRVKELRDQVEASEKVRAEKLTEQKMRVESLQAKVAEQVALQEKLKKSAEIRVAELEAKIKEGEEQYRVLKESSMRLVEAERRRCLEYIPSKETEPNEREIKIWQELQMTRAELSRAEDDLQLSKDDKDNFLNSLNRIAQGEDVNSFKEKMVLELLDREQRIDKLQREITEQRDNEKLMIQNMAQYDDQMAALRLEVQRLRNYDCYSKETPYQDLHTEVVDLRMQMESMLQERAGLVSAATSRALMLERHERAAELFVRMTRARRNLAAVIDGSPEPPNLDSDLQAEVSHSLTSVCTTAAETWSALRAERARVLCLESAVLAQNMQLEREGRVRTQLERHRALLEHELLRARQSTTFNEA